MGRASTSTSADAGTITANSSGDRTISFYGVNTKETLTIQYMKNGKRIPEAMEKINWMLRDWRKDEPTQMDPDLIDLVWEIAVGESCEAIVAGITQKRVDQYTNLGRFDQQAGVTEITYAKRIAFVGGSRFRRRGGEK